MLIRRIARVLVIAAIFCCVPRAARADDTNLLSRIPPGANAIAIIDVDQIMKSPMGVKEHWKDDLKNAYASKPLVVPPTATRLVLASMIDPSTMQPAWEVSLIEVKEAPSMEKIARAEGGFKDPIGETPAVWSPINAYFVRLDDRLLGAVAPANRQFTSRWVQRGASQGESLSPFLQASMGTMDAKTCYLFAMDLEDAASPAKIRRRIEQGDFESLTGKTVDVDKVASLFASLKGVRFRVSIGDEPVGSGIVEFGRSTAPLADFAKPLLLEVLAKFGVAIDGLDSWDVAVKGNLLTLNGKLPIEGLKQLFSIVDPPSPLPTDDADDDKPDSSKDSKADKTDKGGKASEKGKAAVAAASKQYYTTIAKITENVGKKVSNATSMTQGAKWVAGDARRISRLPIANVDPDLVTWGTEVSSQLNDLAIAVGQGGLAARSRAAGIQDAYGSGMVSSELEIQGNDNDRIAQQNVSRQRQAAVAEQKAQTAQVATQILREIEASRAKIRVAMAQKYKIEF
jgi:hypothetical protein